MRCWLRVAGLMLALWPSLAAAKSAHSADEPAWRVASELHRGVNVLGYDPIWTDPAKARFRLDHHFKVIRQGGFDFVRVVLQSFDHMDAHNRLDPQWLATLDRVIAAARAAGLRVIVDEHDYDACAEDAARCETKVTAFWRQIAPRYRDAPDTVLFELLNEPHGALDAAHWNAMLARLIPLVRATNPHRTLVIGPTQWNSFTQLPSLALPADDRNILVTVHYYEPFRFTHQGAAWADDVKDLHGIPLTTADEQRIAHDFDTIAAWSEANDRPVLLGEFGAYDGSGTPVAARARYAEVVRKAAEAHHIPWAYWQFDSDFIVYDIAHDRWIEPIRHALIGDRGAADVARAHGESTPKN